MFFVNRLINGIKLKSNMVFVCERLKYSTNSIKTVQFKTCGQLFDKLRQQNPRLYRNSPSDGLDVNIEYVDTIRHNRSHNCSKTIVAIHGIPGYHKHFVELIDHFDTEGSNVRVVALNLPDFSLTRQTMAFWHSTEERSELIRDFLRALNITNIDCLISHSAGIHPVSMLWTDPQELSIKSVGLFCPQPLWLPKYFYRLSKVFALLTQYKFGIKIMDVLRPHLIAHKVGYPMSYANVDEVLLTVVASTYVEQDKLHGRLKVLKNKKIPTIIVYGERDKLVLKSNFKQFLEDLGVNDKHLIYYSSDGSVEKTITDEDWIKVLTFRTGGHFAFAKYCDIVNDQINKLI